MEPGTHCMHVHSYFLESENSYTIELVSYLITSKDSCHLHFGNFYYSTTVQAPNLVRQILTFG